MENPLKVTGPKCGNPTERVYLTKTALYSVERDVSLLLFLPWPLTAVIPTVDSHGVRP